MMSNDKGGEIPLIFSPDKKYRVCEAPTMPLRLTVNAEIYMRLLRPDEAAMVFAEVDRHRDYLRRWLPWLDETHTSADTRPHLEYSWNGYHQGIGFSLGIFFEEHFCGTIGFHAFDLKNRITSLGYWLSEDFTGRGIMTACTGRLVDYAIDDRHMNRVYIRCASENAASRAIPERLGFVHEGTQREAEWLYDHFVDLEIYSMLKREWHARREVACAM